MSTNLLLSPSQGRDPFRTDGQQQMIEPLTPLQRRFADENRAFPGERSLADGRMVFFYREGPMLTRRWLVDQDGRVVQFDSFARAPERQ